MQELTTFPRHLASAQPEHKGRYHRSGAPLGRQTAAADRSATPLLMDMHTLILLERRPGATADVFK